MFTVNLMNTAILNTVTLLQKNWLIEYKIKGRQDSLPGQVRWGSGKENLYLQEMC
jgi:hypothetical protein